MKHLYGDYPHQWGRIKSVDQTPADYASSIERTKGTESLGDIAVRWAVLFGAVFVAVKLLMEKFA